MGRLGRDLQVTLTDSHAGAAPAAGVHIEFRSATDIGTLTRKAVGRRLPPPGSTDAETTKCPHVDLSGPDLPWRYTPEGVFGGAPEKLRPWLALVVGSSSEVKVEGDLAVIEPSVLRDYPLAQSWRWAHIHTPADAPDQEISVRSSDRVARIVSLRPLAPLTLCTAVLVRTFSEAGFDAWDANGIPAAGSTVRALASWSFTTGEGGDFETLAARLQMPPSEDIGKAELRYSLGSLAEPDKVLGPIDVRGALASLASIREPAIQDQVAMAEQMAGLVRQLTSDPDLLGPPDYGRPWVAEPSTHTIGWMQQLREDARFRIHAGTGVWTGVEAQDALMAAAVQQAGALAEATGKISRAAAGLVASSSQWERALPSTPLGRLAVLGPMSARLPVADTGGSVARTIGGPDRPLDSALLSGAGARLLSRSTRVHRNRGHSLADLLGAANRPPDGSKETLRRLESLWEEQGLLDALYYLWELLLAWAEARHGDAESLVDKGVIDCSIRELIMVEFGLDEWEGLGKVLDGSSTAAGLVYGRAQTALLRCALHCTGPRQPDRRCQVRMAMMRIPQPRQLRPIRLEGLAEAISTAVDPRGPESPARRRLQVEITGCQSTH